MGIPLENQLEFTDQQFNKLRSLLHQEAGIALADIKKELMYGRLFRRIRNLNLSGFDDYLSLLEHKPEQEMGDFINSITTNLTGFFREEHHFHYLQNEVLPWIYQRHRIDKRIRIWSAGCSTGEEPYSIAMALLESIPEPQKWDIQILATDIDSQVISTASFGIYGAGAIAKISPRRKQRWFEQAGQEEGGKMIIKKEVRNLVTFKRLNLVDDWAMRNKFDVIFCRNVVIYFDRKTKCRLFARFAEHSCPGGFLFIGHSESLFDLNDSFKLIGNTVYRKTGTDNK